LKWLLKGAHLPKLLLEKCNILHNAPRNP